MKTNILNSAGTRGVIPANSGLVLKTLESLNVSRNPNAPQADVTNAPSLFGDPFGDADFGDADYGDADFGDADFGDADFGDADFGDPSAIDTFRALSGDVEVGDAASRRKRRLKWLKNAGLLIGGGALGYGAAKGIQAIKRNNARKRARKATHADAIRREQMIRANIGKTHRRSAFNFFGLTGAKLTSAPIDPLSTFVADTFKFMMDTQALSTPFLQETAIGTYSAGTWTVSAIGDTDFRYAHGLFLQFGTNMLNAAPSTVIRITASIPLMDGSILTISSTPFVMTYEKGFDVRFLMFPWKLVSNKPLPTLAKYSTSSRITFTVQGLPAESAVSLIVPGSLHPWTVAMRNSIV